MFEIVVATDSRSGIGLAGKLPWSCCEDMQHFKKLTTDAPEGCQNAVIMGRITWESLPYTHCPLPGRYNIVLTRGQVFGTPYASSLDAALAVCASDPRIHRTFVIGGGSVYAEAILRSDCASIHRSVVDYGGECDTFFPDIDPSVWTCPFKDTIVETDRHIAAGDKPPYKCTLSRIVTYNRRA